MKIRHQVETPELIAESKGLMKRIRESRWTPAIVMSFVTLAVVQSWSTNNEPTININNFIKERES